MKKILLVLALIAGISTVANAQIKSSGFKLIGSAGLGISWASAGVSGSGESVTLASGFGAVNPQVELTAGANVIPQLFIGIGLGYEARCGVKDCSGTQNELKIPATLRFYVNPERSNGVIFDVKGGYSRLFQEGEDMNGGNLFIGPGYMFGRCAVSLGYEGSFFRHNVPGGAITFNHNGLAARFSIEF